VLATTTVPEAFPAVVGLNIAFTLALAPEFNVMGRESPEREMPGPDAEIAEIVTLDEPEFVRRTDCVASEPTLTLPKLTEAGETVRFEDFGMPVPLKRMTVGELGALLLIIIFPLAGPVAAALNVADTSAV